MIQTGRRDALVMVLTGAAGAVNVLSPITLGGVPASIMTANLVIAGLSTRCCPWRWSAAWRR
jgi:uncharacterized membrane protein YoaK (UPF0700 family)